MTERYKFEVKFNMKYEYYKATKHVITFEIIFRDHPGSVREYFKKIDELNDEIWDNPSLPNFDILGREAFWDKPVPYIDTTRDFVLGYEFNSKDDYDGKYTFSDDEWKNIKRQIFIIMYANWDESLVPALAFVMRNKKVSPNMVDDFYTIFYDALKKAIYGKHGFHQNLKTLVQEDTNIVFTVDVPIQDRCNVQKLLSYKARPLVNDKNPSVSAITYTFKDDGKTFVVEYFYEEKEARVRYIGCDTPNNKCKSFYHDLFMDNDQMIIGSWSDKTIEIEYVYLKDAKGSGHCSKAVSYMLKVLLLESAKQKYYPYIGKVFISSGYPCHALNCYTHAFINNGFLPKQTELHNFFNETMSVDIADDGAADDTVQYHFEEFESKEQKKKYEREEERKNSVASRTRGAKRKKINPFKPYLKF